MQAGNGFSTPQHATPKHSWQREGQAMGARAAHGYACCYTLVTLAGKWFSQSEIGHFRKSGKFNETGRGSGMGTARKYDNYTNTMITTYSHSALDSHGTDWKSIVAEPFLSAGVSAFWLVTLPFAAVALLGAKMCEGAVAFARGSARKNPLILRRGIAAKGEASLAHGAAAKNI
ncbi:MAG: hypothetical protein ABI233_04460 [Chthoniobacterales bacterium]